MQPSTEPFRVREIWPPGTLIKGDYEIKNKLGGGGFGTVYLAQHRFLGTTHVIKRLHEHFASDPEYVRKFVNEARAVRRLKACPNVVEVEHMTQSEDGHLILVMEHISGGDLAGLIASRPLKVSEVIEYSRQIAIGLQAAHAAGLVHRDIKPQNVMLSQDSTGATMLKLIDFGIAADHLGNEQTSVMRGGSLGYAAPEQWVKAGKELDGRTDLYSLGASMYRMLCGRMPYDSTDIGDWIEQVKKGPPVAPAELRPQVPPPLSKLILELLAVRPEDRPASADEVIRRLSEVSGTAYEEAVDETILLEPRRSKWIPWASGGVVAALSLAGWFVIGHKEQPAAPPVVHQQATQPPAPEPARKAEPDHARLGDAALNAGDYRTALVHFKVLKDAKRLAALQHAVEADADERATILMEKGNRAEAVRLVEGWAKEFPESQRLRALRALVSRAN